MKRTKTVSARNKPIWVILKIYIQYTRCLKYKYNEIVKYIYLCIQIHMWLHIWSDQRFFYIALLTVTNTDQYGWIINNPVTTGAIAIRDVIWYEQLLKNSIPNIHSTFFVCIIFHSWKFLYKNINYRYLCINSI